MITINAGERTAPGPKQRTVLVHLSSGIGNIILATPLLQALHEIGYCIDLTLDADYKQVSDLFSEWCVVNHLVSETLDHASFSRYDAVVPAIPPFYWPRFQQRYRGGSTGNIVERPPDTLFYRNEQEYYLAFARRLGWTKIEPPCMMLPLSPSSPAEVNANTVVLAPGCKTGEMAAKRWPWFSELSERFDNVAVVGTTDDLRTIKGEPLEFPDHCRSFTGKLTLKETARLIASAGIFVGNDSGLSHLAAALGVPTIMLFGPTPDVTLGHLPPNVVVIRAGLACEPCWFTNRFIACQRTIECLMSVSVDAVVAQMETLIGPPSRIQRSRNPKKVIAPA
jgi:ADP-heptose:LPS heptosyltransferase